jgi:hypothetical protein
MTAAPQSIQPKQAELRQVATPCPTPWQVGITLYPYRHFYGPADKAGFCRAVGSCVTALGEEYDVANAAFIVEAVNSHASLKARIQELEDVLRIARSAIWSGGDTLKSITAIDAALEAKPAGSGGS